MEIPKDILLNLVQSEDLLWPEYILYLACYFWSKYQACQQLETTLEEMSSALEIMLECLFLYEDLSEYDEMQPISKVDPDTVRTFMEPFLPHIRFLSMDRSALEIILQKYSCFSSHEKDMIYWCFLGSKFACLPKEFCKTRASRCYVIEPTVYTFGYVEKEIDKLAVTSGEEFPYINSTLSGELFFPGLNEGCPVKVDVMFPTQCKPPGIESESYEESFTVILSNHKFETHMFGPMKKSAKYNSYVHVSLHPKQYFHGGENELSVEIVHHKSGLYPINEAKVVNVSYHRSMEISLKF